MIGCWIDYFNIFIFDLFDLGDIGLQIYTSAVFHLYITEYEYLSLFIFLYQVLETAI